MADPAYSTTYPLLTAKVLAGLKPGPAPYTVKDLGCKGLSVLVLPSGTVTFRWLVRQVFEDGQARSRTITIGCWSAAGGHGTVTLAAARAWKERLHAAHRRGELEAAEAELEAEVRSTARLVRLAVPSDGGRTVAEVAEEYYKARVLGGHNPSKDPKIVRAVLDNQILPALGQLPLLSVTQAQCGDVVVAHSSSAPVHAKKTLRALRAVFAYAQQRGWFTDSGAAYPRPSPVEHLTEEACGIVAEGERDRALTREEIPLFWSGMSRVYPSGHGGWAGPDELTQCALRFLLVIPCRSGELIQAERSELSTDLATWTVPVAHQKRTRKGTATMRDFVHPLPPLAQQLMRRMLALGGDSKYVLASRSGGCCDGKALGRAMRRTFGGKHPAVALPGDPSPQSRDGMSLPTPHDLRRTFATRAPDLGIDDLTIERCLNHRLSRVARTYRRNEEAYLAQRREALVTWAAYLEREVA